MNQKQDRVKQILDFMSRSGPRIPTPKGMVFKPPIASRSFTWGVMVVTMTYKASHFATLALNLPGARPLTLRLAGVDQAEANREFDKLVELIKGGRCET